MKELTIPVVLGTARVGRESEHAARFLARELDAREGVSARFVDVRDHIHTAVTVPPWGKGGADEAPTAWKDIVESADALIFVTPEYNHGYPGELKLLLDSLYGEYKRIPVGLCGVSRGAFGGARVVENIKPVLIELSMIPARNAAYILRVEEAFDAEGDPTDPELATHFKPLFNEIIELARVCSRS